MTRPGQLPPALNHRAQIGVVAEALFAERGFDGTSIREIAQLTGTTKALINHYYQSKEALYLCLLENAVSEVVASVEEIAASHEAPKEKICAVVNYHNSSLVIHSGARFARNKKVLTKEGNAVHRKRWS